MPAKKKKIPPEQSAQHIADHSTIKSEIPNPTTPTKRPIPRNARLKSWNRQERPPNFWASWPSKSRIDRFPPPPPQSKINKHPRSPNESPRPNPTGFAQTISIHHHHHHSTMGCCLLTSRNPSNKRNRGRKGSGGATDLAEWRWPDSGGRRPSRRSHSSLSPSLSLLLSLASSSSRWRWRRRGRGGGGRRGGEKMVVIKVLLLLLSVS